MFYIRIIIRIISLNITIVCINWFSGDHLLNGSPYAIGPLCVLPCLSVCNVGVLWPNSWMDQDETQHGGRPWPRPQYARWWPSSPQRHSPHFLAHVYCGQTAGWIKMPLGMEVDLSSGHTVLDGDPASPKGTQQPPSFRPMSIVAKRLPISATAEHLLFVVMYKWMSKFKEMSQDVWTKDVGMKLKDEKTWGIHTYGQIQTARKGMGTHWCN